jgi:hypothetical protein
MPVNLAPTAKKAYKQSSIKICSWVALDLFSLSSIIDLDLDLEKSTQMLKKREE